MDIRNIPLEKIKPDKNQPRQTIDHNKIRNMAESIKTEGVINPIEIDKNYTIITGELRWRAAKIAGLKTIRAVFVQVSGRERYRRQVVENIHNTTMSPWDTAISLKYLISSAAGDKKGHYRKGITALSREIGMPESTAKEYLSILDAPQPLQKAVRENRVQFSVLSALKGVPPAFKERVEQKILNGDFVKNRDALRQVARDLKSHPEKADEILSVKHISQLKDIVPQRSDVIKQSFTNIEHFDHLVDSLLKWLDTNSPQSVGKIHHSSIILAFNVLLNTINNWGVKPQLKGNSDQNGNLT